MASTAKNLMKAASLLTLTAAMAFSGPVQATVEQASLATDGVPVQQRQQNGTIIPYKGADDPQALRQTVQQMSRNQAVFVMFYATWCNHCENLAAAFTQIAGQTPLPYQVLPVPVSDLYTTKEGKQAEYSPYPNIKKAYEIKGYPQTVVVMNGMKVKEYESAMSPQQLVAEMAQLYTTLQSLQQRVPSAPSR
jgi:thiol-disulfide isomerase/thioredoxin